MFSQHVPDVDPKYAIQLPQFTKEGEEKQGLMSDHQIGYFGMPVHETDSTSSTVTSLLQ